MTGGRVSGGAALAAAALMLLAGGTASAQARLDTTPPFRIWDVEIGAPVTQIPPLDVVELACGTGGGPASLPLASPGDFLTCRPEETGLREVTFRYDDELEYIARAMNYQYRVAQRGTSVFAQPVIVSVLVDEGGVVRGIRIVTDDRAGEVDRRKAASLVQNFKGRFFAADFQCEDLPPKDGEEPVGRIFKHEICTGTLDGLNIRMEARHMRKPGQIPINPVTLEQNTTYYESQTRFEMVEDPYMPVVPREVRPR